MGANHYLIEISHNCTPIHIHHHRGLPSAAVHRDILLLLLTNQDLVVVHC